MERCRTGAVVYTPAVDASVCRPLRGVRRSVPHQYLAQHRRVALCIHGRSLNSSGSLDRTRRRPSPRVLQGFCRLLNVRSRKSPDPPAAGCVCDGMVSTRKSILPGSALRNSRPDHVKSSRHPAPGVAGDDCRWLAAGQTTFRAPRIAWSGSGDHLGSLLASVLRPSRSEYGVCEAQHRGRFDRARSARAHVRTRLVRS
jgi:hypothetical protein